MATAPHVLMAVLNWGIGHATRSSVIIHRLLALGVRVTVASDGTAAQVLRREFPDLLHLDLPGYHIAYSRRHLAAYLLWQVPRVMQRVRAEHRLTTAWVRQYDIHGIISDNRYGAWSPQVPSVIVTHQVRLPIGHDPVSTWLGEQLHRPWLRPFGQCWVPDHPDPAQALAGRLSHHLGTPPKSLYYIGWLGRLHPPATAPVTRYAVGVVLSGLEPLRTDLEQNLYAQLTALRQPCLLIRGLPSGAATPSLPPVSHIEVMHYATAEQLQQLLPQCRMLIMRSGYSSLMDTAPLQVPTLLIPTPGQAEQSYLARYLARHNSKYHVQPQHALSVADAWQRLSGWSTSSVSSHTDFLTPVLQSWLQTLAV